MSIIAKTEQNLCPKCRNGLRLIVETENRQKMTVVSYLYTCDVCRYRRIVDSIVIKMNSDKLIVMKNTSDKLS